jgi:hypothetical protein
MLNHLIFVQYDVIIELPDDRWDAIEIKLGEDKIEAGIAALTWWEAMLSANPMARTPKPTFKMVLVGNTGFARHTKPAKTSFSFLSQN